MDVWMCVLVAAPQACIFYGDHLMATLSLLSDVATDQYLKFLPVCRKERKSNWFRSGNICISLTMISVVTAGHLTPAATSSSPAVSSTSMESTRDGSVRSLSIRNTLTSSRR